MFWNKLFAKRSALSKAQTAGICERLEPRWLLATYTVPAGNMAAYLVNGEEEGQVIVKLNDPDNPVTAHTFEATTGQHVVDAGTNGTA